MILATGFTSSKKRKEVSCLHIHLGGGRDEASIGLDENLFSDGEQSKMGHTEM